MPFCSQSMCRLYVSALKWCSKSAELSRVYRDPEDDKTLPNLVPTIEADSNRAAF